LVENTESTRPVFRELGAGPAPHAGDLLQGRREVGALHRLGEELEGAGPDNLDHGLGRDVTSHGEDGRFGQRLGEFPNGVHRRVAVSASDRRRHLDEHEIRAAVGGLEERLPDLAELSHHHRSGHAAQALAKGRSGLGVRVDYDDAKDVRHV
jgi:hypothetical protein